jgi:outer membrane protein assembly factor BamB
LDALDLNRGRMLWQRAFGDNPELRKHRALKDATLPTQLGAVGSAGVIATGGGLVFAGGGDYAFHAIDKQTGEDLWTYSTGELRTNGTPMTYRLEGRQYVVIAVGGPGHGATLLAFALPQGPVAAAAPPAPAGARGPIDVEHVCAQCHSFEVVAQSRRTRRQWEAQIESMIAKGAKISDEDFDAIADYLAAHFGGGK